MTCQQERLSDLLVTILLLTIVCAGTVAGIHAAPADSPATPAVVSPTVIQLKRLPMLAVTVLAEDDKQRKEENIDDLLAVEMANQSVFQIVDRHKIQAVLKEHAIALSNTGSTQNAIALGKFVGADYLLVLRRNGRKMASR